MSNLVKTAAGRLTVKTSATNLDLTVTNEAEFKNLIGGFRDGFAQTGKKFSDELKSLGSRKRDAFWLDLAAAYFIIMEVLMKPEFAEWLYKLLDELGVPIVEDEDKQNIFVMYLRLLTGYWPAKPKGWKEGDAEPEFTWSDSVWLWASILRGAVKRGVKPADFYATCVKEKGTTKFQKADKARLAQDQEEKDKRKRFEALTGDDQIKVIVPVEGFNLTATSGMVALYGRISADKSSIEVLGALPDSAKAVEARIHKIPVGFAQQVMLNQADRRVEDADKRAEAAEQKVRELMLGVSEKIASAFDNDPTSEDAA